MVLSLTSYLTYEQYDVHDEFPDVYYFIFTCVIDLKRLHAHDTPLSSESRIFLCFIIRYLLSRRQYKRKKDSVAADCRCLLDSA